MITPVSIYHLGTGEVKSTGGIQFETDLKDIQVAAALAPWGADTHGLIEESLDPLTKYVYTLDNERFIADRPPIPYQIDKTTITADGLDFLTISGLHNPCDVIVDDPDPLVETTVTTVTGGSFEFAAEDPGLYTIEISRFPFLPMKLDITATAPEPPP